MRSKSSADPWTRLRDAEPGLLSPKPQVDVRVLILAAHPDDETIGASTILTRIPDVTVVFVTDGAPRDPTFWSADAKGSRTDYARMRCQEALSALSLAGVSAEQALHLGAVDQDAILEAPALVAWFSTLLGQLQPEVLVTHPYEGGHPDHDTAALIAQLATWNMQCQGESVAAPQLIEMTSYHAREGICETGTFLPGEAQSPSELLIELSSDLRARKEAMLAAYASQQLILQRFNSQTERFRLAPSYDFTHAPHAGNLWYECLGWPMTGARWRELARHAAAECKGELCV